VAHHIQRDCTVPFCACASGTASAAQVFADARLYFDKSEESESAEARLALQEPRVRAFDA
jgi:hypothetical protein